MDPCPKCGTAYCFASDPDAGVVRSICECELDQHCAKCKRGARSPVNQARLNHDEDVRAYTCARHGLIDAEGFARPVAPIPMKSPRTPRTKAAAAASPPIPKASERASRPARQDLLTIEGMRAEIATRKDMVVCSHCLVARAFHTYRVQLDAWGIPQPTCGLCGRGTPRFTGRGA